VDYTRNVLGQVTAARARGSALAQLPAHVFGVQFQRLGVRLLPAYTHEKADILAVYPHRRNLSPKVRAFVDFLAEHLSDAPDWESISPPSGVHVSA
jgi:DNA-binding transcriptional LysR family regulator